MKAKTGFFFLVLCLIFSGFSAIGQAYKIEVKINGLKDTSLYLGNYYGDKKYAVDTIRLDSKGYGVFKGNEKLKQGFYLIITHKMLFFEIVIGEDQKFTIENDTADFMQHLKINGSQENIEFLEYQKYMIEIQKKAMHLKERITANKANKDSTKILQDQMDVLFKERNDKNKKYITDHPDYILSKVIQVMDEPQVPDFPRDDKGNITDSLFQYRYFKDHYFDHVDMTDERLIRTPVFYNKLHNFMTKVVMQHPDSINAEADKLIERARKNDEMFKYIVIYMLNLYNTTKIMGMDKVYVHIAEKYYISGEAIWTDTAFIEKMKERVNKIKPNLIGVTAPDLKLYTYDFRPVSLHSIKLKYTILYFWEPDCGHCKKSTPVLHDLYEKYKDKGVGVFAVCIQNDTAKWFTFMKEHKLFDWINAFDPMQQSKLRDYYDIYSTPVIYILNEKKEIIAKRIDIEAVESVLCRELGIKLEKKETDKEILKESPPEDLE